MEQRSKAGAVSANLWTPGLSCSVRDALGVGAGGGLRALPSPQQPGQGYSEALFQLEVPHSVLSSGITVVAKKRLCPTSPDPLLRLGLRRPQSHG